MGVLTAIGATFVAAAAGLRAVRGVSETGLELYQEVKPLLKAAAYLTIAVALINLFVLEVKR